MLSEPQTLVHPGTESPSIFARTVLSGSNSTWAAVYDSSEETESLDIRNRVIGKAGAQSKQHNVIFTHTFVGENGVDTASCSVTFTHSLSGSYDHEQILFRMFCRAIGLLTPNIADVDELTVHAQFKQIIRGEP